MNKQAQESGRAPTTSSFLSPLFSSAGVADPFSKYVGNPIANVYSRTAEGRLSPAEAERLSGLLHDEVSSSTNMSVNPATGTISREVPRAFTKETYDAIKERENYNRDVKANMYGKYGANAAATLALLLPAVLLMRRKKLKDIKAAEEEDDPTFYYKKAAPSDPMTEAQFQDVLDSYDANPRKPFGLAGGILRGVRGVKETLGLSEPEGQSSLSNPLALTAILLGTAGLGYGGYRLADWITDKERQKRLESRKEQLRKQYMRLLSSGLSKQSALASALDEAASAFEKEAQTDAATTNEWAKNLAVLLALSSLGVGGVMGYRRGKSTSEDAARKKSLESAVKNIRLSSPSVLAVSPKKKTDYGEYLAPTKNIELPYLSQMEGSADEDRQRNLLQFSL